LSSNNSDNNENVNTNIDYDLSSDSAKVSVVIKTENTDQIYKRIFLPPSARLTAVSLNNNSLISGLLPVTSVNNLIGWGFLINTSPGTSSNLKMDYELPVVITNQHLHVYIDNPNQPGVKDNPGIITINYPKNWQASTLSNPAVATPGTLRYNTSSRDYQKIEIDFQIK
jgi:hypothetical protein